MAGSQKHIKVGLNISMEGDPTSLAACARAQPLSQHRSSSSCPYGTPWAPSVRSAPRPGAEHHRTEPGTILLTPTLQILISTDRCPPSLLFSITSALVPASLLLFCLLASLFRRFGFNILIFPALRAVTYFLCSGKLKHRQVADLIL